MDQRLSDTPRTDAAGPPPPRDEFIQRFALPTRLAHWGLAIPFILLLLTGLTNYVPSLKAIEVADFRLFGWLHVGLGFGMLGILAWVLLGLVPRRSVRSDVGQLAEVGLDDYLWVQHQALHFSGESSVPPQVRKFNTGQKLNALLSGLVTLVLLGTGVILGVNYISKSVFSVELVEPLFRWHGRIALLFVPVLLGHVYLAILNPSTRESLRGMTMGVVRLDWARRHHPAWVARREGKPRA
jgi:formate dehydrogenase subunit gamma